MSAIRRADLAYLETLQANLGSAINQTQDLISLMQNALAPTGDGVSSRPHRYVPVGVAELRGSRSAEGESGRCDVVSGLSAGTF